MNPECGKFYKTKGLKKKKKKTKGLDSSKCQSRLKKKKVGRLFQA